MPLPNLLVTKEDARRKIDSQLKKGREIRDSTTSLFSSERDLETARKEKSKWVKYTRDLLEVIFDSQSMADEFDPRGFVAGLGIRTFHEQMAELREEMDRYLARLESIHERVDLARETLVENPAGFRTVTRAPSDAIPTIFISHSSQDEDVIRVVKQAFDELSLTPLFNERHPAGAPPAETLVQRIANSKAVFVFFTFNSIFGATRDWIIFELGAAQAYDKPIFAWVQKAVGKDSLPKLLEQLTIYRPFEVQSNQGTIELVKDVRQAAKNLPR